MNDIIEAAGYASEYAALAAEAEQLKKRRESAEDIAGLRSRYAALSAHIRALLSNAKFIATMERIAMLFPDRAAYRGGVLYYRGRVPEMAGGEGNTSAADIERDVRASVLAIVRGEGDVDAALRALAADTGELRRIASDPDGCARAESERELSALGARADACAARMRELERLAGGDAESVVARIKTALAALPPSDTAGRLRAEKESGIDYPRSVSLGRVRTGLGESVAAFLRDNGIDPAALSDTRLELSHKGPGCALMRVDRAFERRGDEFFDMLCGLVFGALADFEPGRLKLAFAESIKSLPMLAPLCDIMNKDVSPDVMYRRVAQDRAHVAELFSSLLDELKSRLTVFRTVRKENGSTCADIAEYNALNRDNALPSILVIVNGYPGDADRDALATLNELLEGGRAGIFVLVITDEEPRSDERDRMPSLPPDITEVRLDAEGNAVCDGREVFPPHADGSTFAEVRTALAERLRHADAFYLDSVMQTESDAYFGDRISIPLGNAEGRLYSLVTGTERPPYPFTLVTGSAGSGKSAFLHSLIMSGAMKYSPDELQFNIIDFKTKTDSREFAGYISRGGEEDLYIPHVTYLSLRSRPENALEVIRYIKDLMSERNKLGKFAEYNSSPEVRSGKRKPMPMIYVIIDEYENMLSGGDGNGAEGDPDLLRPRIVEGVTTILKRARAFGIGVIFSGQAAKLPADAMDQISNRIAFYNGSGIYERVFGKWDDRNYARFPAREYRGYAFCATNGTEPPSFVRMAYAGSPDGKRMRELAARIREKYPTAEKRRQVVVGVTSSAVVSGPDTYRTWAEEAAYRADISRIEDPDDFATSGIEEGMRALRPLALGISSSSSLPVSLEYSTDANGVGCFACANERTLFRIERNAALAFLFQTADIAGGPRVVYCEDGTRTPSAYDECFGECAARREWPSARVEHVTGREDTARLLISLNSRSRADGPVLVILHEAEWMEPDRLAKWTPARSESAEKPSGDGYYERLKATGASIPPALMEKIKHMNIGAVTGGSEKKDVEVTVRGLRDAFSELYLSGGRKGVFLLVTTERYGTVSSVVLSLAPDSRARRTLSEHGAYGSFEEMRRQQTTNTSANTCFVMPVAASTRLYDYAQPEADAWWADLGRRLSEGR